MLLYLVVYLKAKGAMFPKTQFFHEYVIEGEINCTHLKENFDNTSPTLLVLDNCFTQMVFPRKFN